MLDFLIALGQFACLLGLGYGAFLCFTHHDRVEHLVAHDEPIAIHDWLVLKHETRLRVVIIPMTREETRAAEPKLAA